MCTKAVPTGMCKSIAKQARTSEEESRSYDPSESCISCASTVMPLSQPGSPANTRGAARSSTWVRNGLQSNGRAFQGCVRFKSLEDLALDVVGRTVARVSAEEHMANYRAARALLGKGKKGAKKSAVKKV
jgi:hypothetical protein